jgi:nicotinamidase-related amidase
MAAATPPFKPALLVVDVQEDFCPPQGSLAVPHGRDILPAINALLAMPFSLRLATRDWHPLDHVSFAANHSPPRQPFTSSTTITHPDGGPGASSYSTTLWPVHCVRGTPGAQLVPGLREDRLHGIIDKGMDARVEMYSAFYDPFRVCDSGLAERLRREQITHVYVVGLAADYCVKATAEHAAAEGFTTFIVDEATRPVMPDKWEACSKEITAKGIEIISIDGPQVAQVTAEA